MSISLGEHLASILPGVHFVLGRVADAPGQHVYLPAGATPPDLPEWGGERVYFHVGEVPPNLEKRSWLNRMYQRFFECVRYPYVGLFQEIVSDEPATDQNLLGVCAIGAQVDHAAKIAIDIGMTQERWLGLCAESFTRAAGGAARFG